MLLLSSMGTSYAHHESTSSHLTSLHVNIHVNNHQIHTQLPAYNLRRDSVWPLAPHPQLPDLPLPHLVLRHHSHWSCARDCGLRLSIAVSAQESVQCDLLRAAILLYRHCACVSDGWDLCCAFDFDIKDGCALLCAESKGCTW